MFKLNGNLYTLATDQGYLKNNLIAWEKLAAVDGDTEYVSPTFGSPSEYAQSLNENLNSQITHPSLQNHSSSAMDPDMLLALQLHHDEQHEQERNSAAVVNQVGQEQLSLHQEQQFRQQQQSEERCILL